MSTFLKNNKENHILPEVILQCNMKHIQSLIQHSDKIIIICVSLSRLYYVYLLALGRSRWGISEKSILLLSWEIGVFKALYIIEDIIFNQRGRMGQCHKTRIGNEKAVCDGRVEWTCVKAKVGIWCPLLETELLNSDIVNLSLNFNIKPKLQIICMLFCYLGSIFNK